MQTDALIGVQDMGAAGLTCSTCEMGARGGAGIEIDVARVPQRETGMTPYEIMLSESQERMLLVVKKGREAEVERDLREVGPARRAHRRGHRATACMRVKDHGEVVAEIPEHRAGGRGARLRPSDEASGVSRRECRSLDLSSLAPVAPQDGAADGCSASPTIASKRWVYRQYDTMVRTNTIALGGHDARASSASREPIARWRCRPTATAATAISNPRRGAMLARRRGGAQRRLRRRACRSARPTASTSATRSGPRSCGSSSRRSKGIAEACRALDIPITGGNVSLYNETDGRAIYPTPVIGVVGVIEDASARADARVPGRRRRGHPARRGSRRARRQRVSEGRARARARRRAGARSRRAKRRCCKLVTGGRGAGCCDRRTTAPTAASR